MKQREFDGLFKQHGVEPAYDNFISGIARFLEDYKRMVDYPGVS